MDLIFIRLNVSAHLRLQDMVLLQDYQMNELKFKSSGPGSLTSGITRRS